MRQLFGQTDDGRIQPASQQVATENQTHLSSCAVDRVVRALSAARAAAITLSARNLSHPLHSQEDWLIPYFIPATPDELTDGRVDCASAVCVADLRSERHSAERRGNILRARFRAAPRRPCGGEKLFRPPGDNENLAGWLALQVQGNRRYTLMMVSTCNYNHVASNIPTPLHLLIKTQCKFKHI